MKRILLQFCILSSALLLLSCSEQNIPVTSESSREEVITEATSSETTSARSQALNGIPSSYADIDRQLEMIAELHDVWVTSGDDPTFYYCITDMDHNNRLEVIYMSEHFSKPFIQFYEISPTYDSLDLLEFTDDPENMFLPEILYLDTYDCYYDGTTYYYVTYDFSVNEEGLGVEHTVLLSLTDGVIDSQVICYDVMDWDSDTPHNYFTSEGIPLPDEEAYNDYPAVYMGIDEASPIGFGILGDFQSEIEDITHSFKVFLGLE